MRRPATPAAPASPAAPTAAATHAVPASGVGLSATHRPPRSRRRILAAFASTGRARLALVVAALALAVVALANPYHVEQFSMERTLEPGELLLVDRLLPSLTGFARGDIVLVRLATSKPGDPPLVKRVIGLPGETVAFRDGAVWIDGRRLAEPYVFDGQETWPQPGHPSAVVVPEGSVFVLGDHRSSSTDSRLFGPVAEDDIIGRVWFEARVDALATLLGF